MQEGVGGETHDQDSIAWFLMTTFDVFVPSRPLLL
jgi:hypothetical protein